ncbi:DUF2599 domain-containing protein [Gordonia sp. DT30]|uniref:DUF2599 domain-containing protein n=1 Tax=unclassified Gordonia (in: high G+C Gram-positive bacteria) TaxID=2657482 RepID=UPI003CE7D7C1
MNRRPWNRVPVAVVGVAVAATLAAGLSACGDDSAPAPTSAPATTSVDTTPTSSGDESGAASPTTDPVYRPPYVDHVEWVQTQVGPSLQIYPTPSGRKTTSTDGADVAWSEVLAFARNADTPGMRAQFDCHWTYARLVDPDKPSWNIEPDRPVVSQQEMVATRCNPGGPEE